VAIYNSRARSTKYLEGEVFTGPAKTKDYPVEVLPAGEYYFDCVVHLDMNGALYVR
jgi:hypothetical protein